MKGETKSAMKDERSTIVGLAFSLSSYLLAISDLSLSGRYCRIGRGSLGEEAEGKKRDEVELVTEAAASDIYLG